MEIFAVICLVVILIAMTHLHNWIIRNMYYDLGSDQSIVIIIVSTVLYIVIAASLVRTMIIWGQKITQHL